MRWVIAALAFAGLAACDMPEGKTGESSQAPADSYTVEIRANEGAQTYLITNPAGRTIGARAAEGQSALMDQGRAQALAGEPPPQGEVQPEVFAMRWPGFDLRVAGKEDDANGENSQVQVSIGGANGQRVEVHADEGGAGEADDQAFVRITGMDEQAVRDFVAEAEELSPDVKTQLLTELGPN